MVKQKILLFGLIISFLVFQTKDVQAIFNHFDFYDPCYKNNYIEDDSICEETRKPVQRVVYYRSTYIEKFGEYIENKKSKIFIKEFSENNQIIKYQDLRYTYDSGIWFYTYNKNNKISEASFFSNVGDLKKKVIFSFDNEESVMSKDEYDSDGSKNSREEFQLKADGNIVLRTVVEYGWDFEKSDSDRFWAKKVITNFEYLFNDNKLIEERVERINNGYIASLKYVYIVDKYTYYTNGYYKKDRYLSDKKITAVDPKYLLISIKFNEEGLFIEINSRNKAKSIFEYEYNIVGDWVKRKHLVEVEKFGKTYLEPREVIYREIEYF